MDDQSIVELYLQRDERAIRETAEKYGNRLRGLACGIVEDAQTAEECENDTYLEAWNSIPPHEPRDYLYAFLARITRHIALNCCRDRNRLKRRALICELSTELEQCIPDPDDTSCRLDDMTLRQAINSFSNSYSLCEVEVAVRLLMNSTVSTFISVTNSCRVFPVVLFPVVLVK